MTKRTLALLLSWTLVSPLGVFAESRSIKAPISGVRVTAAVLAAPSALDPHPGLTAIAAVEKAGVALPEAISSTREAFEALRAARELPEGPARGTLLRLANAALNSRGGGPAGGEAFDGSEAPKGFGAQILETLSGFSILPQAWRLGFSRQAAQWAKVPPIDPRRFELKSSEVRYVPPAGLLPASTRDIQETGRGIVGQDAALKAIRFGARMPGKGYGVYVARRSGSGGETAVRDELAKLAPTRPSPLDLVAAPALGESGPIVLALPTGSAAEFKQGIETFLSTYEKQLPKLLSRPELQAEGRALRLAADKERVEALEAIRKGLTAQGAVFGRFGATLHEAETEKGVFVAPKLTLDGKPVRTPEEAQKLIAAGRFTEAEWKEGLAKSQEAFETALGAVAQAMNRYEDALEAAAEKTRQTESAAAARLALALASQLPGFGTGHDTPEHKAWEEKRDGEMKAFYDKVAAFRAGPLGIDFSFNGQSVILRMVEHVGSEAKPLEESQAEAKLAAGEISAADFQKYQEAAQAFLNEFVAMLERHDQEHEQLHAGAKVPEHEAQVSAYLQGLAEDVASRWREIVPAGKAKPTLNLGARYRTSVLASNEPGKGAPVVFAKTNSYEEIFGMASPAETAFVPGKGPVRILGHGTPAFEPGLIHQANGGYLVVDDDQALRQPGVHDALMRYHQSGEAEISEGGIENLLTGRGRQYHIPVNVKVVRVGSPLYYYLLSEHEPGFKSHYKAIAEFEPELKAGPEAIGAYLQFLRKVITKSAGELLEMERAAIGRVIEYAAELADSNRYLTSQFGAVHDLLREASQAARDAKREEVTLADVEKAFADRREREGVFERHYLARMMDRTTIIDTQGSKLGQINKLAVMMPGDFGVPLRATFVDSALDRFELVSNDHLAGRTGNDFEKALANAEGYYEWIYAHSDEIMRRFRYSEEQNYGLVDGDSGTTAKIVLGEATLAGAKIHQNLAITGSSDMQGNMEVIGGVNEKIKGFFALCAAKGLTGDQGVVIPRGNVGELALPREIQKAIDAGRFHVYAVDTVSQALEIMTGVPALKIQAENKKRIKAWAREARRRK